MAPHLQVKAGSEEELARAMALLQPAWEECHRMMGDLAGADAIRKIILRMQSSGGGTRVSIEDRRAWFKGIITHYQQQCVSWRRFDDARPILSRSVTAMAESYSVKSLLVHLREKLATSPDTTLPLTKPYENTLRDFKGVCWLINDV